MAYSISREMMGSFMLSGKKRSIEYVLYLSNDHRDRLTSWTLNGAQESYTYDLIGNLLTKGAATYSYDYTRAIGYGGPYALNANIGYTYDPNGNLLSSVSPTTSTMAQDAD